MEPRMVAGAAGVAVAVLVLLVVGVDPAGRSADQDALASSLDSAGIAMDQQDVSVVSMDRRTVDGTTITEVTARNGQRWLTVSLLHPVTQRTAAAYIADTHSGITSLYTGATAPYSGIAGRETDCPDRFRPVVSNGTRQGTYRSYRMYADADRALGACSDATARYAAEVLLLHCPAAGTVATVRRFVPRDAAANISLSSTVRCRR